jgi:hypothetical protein
MREATRPRVTLRPVIPRHFASLAALALACVLAADVDDAAACGGFFRRASLSEDRVPSLAYEQTLIVFDEAKQREHFVREVVLNAGQQTFGFVVPTPARPEVAAMESPFGKLHKSFPFGPRYDMDKSRAGGGAKRAASTPGAGVEVLEKKRVGSFTAFVLAATDRAALSKWLADNQFASTKSNDAWLAHYVELGFFYVAMRYDPPAEAGARIIAETLRISFDAPLPYYPYLEPENPGATPDLERMLDVWLVSKRRYVPVAAKLEGSSATWVRPLKPGSVFTGGERPALERSLGDAKNLLPAGDDLVIQRFADQKRSRAGFGDVVFVPSSPVELDAAAQKRLLAFGPLLNPKVSAP